MKNRAILYLRSSKDRSDVSIDAQRRALHELAVARGLVVVDEYIDAVESGKDEDRPAFQRLLRALKDSNRGWWYVLVLDTSRVARRRHLALIFEHECERADIAIIYRNVPDTDPITSMLLKSILQAMDEWHSLTSKAKGLAGMAENVRQGWRAGGRAPRGYQLDYHATGAVRDGQPVLKSRLVPNDDAPTVRAYLIGRAAGHARGYMIRTLGLDWPVNSLNGMEWQALTYAGHTVWNVHAERTTDGYVGGEKRRPRSEWVMTRDTHDALITDDQAEAILTQIEHRRMMRTRDNGDRAWLLTGFLASPNGDVWAGEWDTKMNAGLYRVGRGRKISAKRVDAAVLDRIEADLKSAEVAQLITDQLRRPAAKVDGRTTAGMEKRLVSITNKISRLVDLLTEADPAEAAPYQRSIKDAEAERAMLVQELADARIQQQQRNVAAEITIDQVRAMLTSLFADLKAGMDAGQVETTKAALGGLISKIVLDPESNQCVIHYQVAAPDTGVKLASPRGTDLNPVSWTSEIKVPARRRM